MSLDVDRNCLNHSQKMVRPKGQGRLPGRPEEGVSATELEPRLSQEAEHQKLPLETYTLPLLNIPVAIIPLVPCGKPSRRECQPQHHTSLRGTGRAGLLVSLQHRIARARGEGWGWLEVSSRDRGPGQTLLAMPIRVSPGGIRGLRSRER
jgi:hypothetical protein